MKNLQINKTLNKVKIKLINNLFIKIIIIIIQRKRMKMKINSITKIIIKILIVQNQHNLAKIIHYFHFWHLIAKMLILSKKIKI